MAQYQMKTRKLIRIDRLWLTLERCLTGMGQVRHDWLQVMLEEWSGESTTGRGPVEQEASSGRAGGTAWQLRRLSAVLL
jgi:hypothetical protein